MFKSACVVLLLISASACSSPTTPMTPSTSSLAVTGTMPAVGQTSQLTAIATLSNGTSQDVTTQATWSSSNTAVATVTAGGRVTLLQLGDVVITATYQGMSGKLSVLLSVTSVTVAGPTSLTVIQPVQFTATATFSDGTTQDVTRQATWSTNGNTLTVAQGLVTPVLVTLPSYGIVISAAYQGVTGQTSSLSIAQQCNVTSVTGSPNWRESEDGDPVVGAFDVPPGGGAFTVTVEGSPGCSWTTLTYDSPASGDPKNATVPSSYGTITSGANGVGNGIVSLSITPRSGCPVGGVLIQPSAAANVPLELRLKMSNLGVAAWTCE